MSQKIFITGASSGIGEYLAYAYAKRGCSLGLFARRKEALEEIKEKCESQGGKALLFPGDVTNEDRVKSAINDFVNRFGQIDVVYANAGVGAADPIWKGETDDVHRVLNTNISGVVNTVFAAVPYMVKQQSGKIAVISSVAGFRGLPRHGAYSGSKEAVRSMADSWRNDLIRNNIQITTIHPEFIKTPMVKNNNSFMPFLMDVESAAERIIKALESGKKSYIFPWQWRLVIPLLKIIPDALLNAVYFKK